MILSKIFFIVILCVVIVCNGRETCKEKIHNSVIAINELKSTKEDFIESIVDFDEFIKDYKFYISEARKKINYVLKHGDAGARHHANQIKRVLKHRIDEYNWFITNMRSVYSRAKVRKTR